MVEDDSLYFLRRAAEELVAAERATSPEAESVHRELARRYALMIDDRPDLPEPMSENLSGAPPA